MLLITGLFYPLLITGLGQLFFMYEAKGSLIQKGTQIIGSKLIAQDFQEPQYFWPRHKFSASGLDPDLTVEMAYEQTPRIAKARGIPTKELENWLHLDKETSINVFISNLDLDQFYVKEKRHQPHTQ